MDNQFLSRCGKIYDAVAKHIVRLKDRGHAASALTWIEMLATLSWWNHPGRYADGRVENIALEIGENLEQEVAKEADYPFAYNLPKLPNDARRKVLHVATTCYMTGGHTRLILNLIKNDPATCHSLLITSQGTEIFPQWLGECVSENGGISVALPTKASLLSKAKWLREIAGRDVDMVFLHHHPSDVVPVVALATKQSPPVAIINHADHAFWLGSSVADLIVNVRNSGKVLSEERRSARKNLILPIPLNVAATAQMTREEARKQLNIPENQIVLLSMGEAFKYKPTETCNFYQTTVEILDRNPDAHLYLIGVEWNETISYLREAWHDRLHFLGVVENPSLYKTAADLYLEGFPFGSLTALLEVALSGVCPVLAPAPTSAVLSSNDVALDGIVGNVKDEREFIIKVNSLIQNRDERESLGRRVKQSILTHHAGQRWQEYLQNIYRCLEESAHAPARIPKFRYRETMDDLSLSTLSRNLQMYKPPLLLNISKQFFTKLTLADVTDLFTISLKTQDTKMCYRHLSILIRYHSHLFKHEKLAGMLMASLRARVGYESSHKQLNSWLKIFRMVNHNTMKALTGKSYFSDLENYLKVIHTRTKA